MEQEIVKLAEKLCVTMRACSTSLISNCEYGPCAKCCENQAKDMEKIYDAICKEAKRQDPPKTVKVTVSADKQLSGALKKAYWRQGVCERALNRYGTDHQIIKAVEELGELSAALSRCVNRKGDKTLEQHYRDVRGELADVEIMCRQLEMIVGGVEGERDDKLARLEKRMDKDAARKDKSAMV